MNESNGEVDVTPAGRIHDQRKPQSIGSALRYSLRKGSLLPFLRFRNLFLRQISLPQTLVQVFKRSSVHDVEGTDDIAKRFGHLAPFAIADERVAEDFAKWDLAGVFQGQHDHASNPKGENVPTTEEKVSELFV